MFDLLKELTELPGPIGREQAVADYLRDRWALAGADVTVTRVGNVVADLGGKGPRLMIQAHMDEMSLSVRSIDSNGFVRLATGARGGNLGILPESVNREAIILTRSGPVNGIFARPTGHLRSTSGSESGAPDWDTVWIDLGLSSRDQVQAAGVHVGSPVLYKAETRQLGRHIVGKAFDDRIGLAVMTSLAERIDRAKLTHNVVLVGTIQEETGAIGASSLRADLGEFDAAIALEVGPAGDTPGSPSGSDTVALGQGTCIVHEDAAAHYDPALTDALINLAEKNDIPFQHALFTAFGTDGVNLMMQGIPTALLAVPTRYTHSPFEMVTQDDINATLQLLEAYVTS
ncbi:aminopeptidase [Arthrobacter sp. MYb23]|uniref:M42 family metallopeptidase n=1 Tax=unclassified Arthrobacter TaxID=235627 RepID=UPI000CFAB5A1|nr:MULTISPECIES: M42 family metallopeptidase [unclassified Arthrobacter]PRB43063.1 aminopeptidase [Arthrobacter sp. MYb51]PRB98015.1 aminopeptidase [Arthrobacter sp. MYb23]